VLEGESQQTLDNQLRLFHDRALPDLGGNIKCGNSLIGPDFYDNQQLELLDDEERYRINVFDWQAEFPQVFQSRADVQSRARKEAESSHRARKEADSPSRADIPSRARKEAESSHRARKEADSPSHDDDKAPLPHGRGSDQNGGFDAVIGNPPYGGYFSQEEKTFLNIRYHCQTYQLDSYQLFLERAVTLFAASGGYIGMIIPNPWLTNILQTKLRAMVVRKTRVVEVVHFLFAVFPKVTVDTEVVILQRDPVVQADCNVRIVERIGISEGPYPVFIGRTIKHDQESWRQTEGGVINLFLSESEKRLARKTVEGSCTLGNLCAINVGIKPYQQGKGKPPQSKTVVERRVFDSDRKIDGTFREYLRGADIQRYVITPVEPRFIKYGPWLAEPRPAANFDAPKKLLMRQTGDRPIAALDTKKYLCLNNLHVIVPKTMFPAVEFLLGVLNSSLVQWYYYTLNPEVGEALAEVKRTNVSLLPIPRISDEGKKSRNAHTRMVEVVERMLDLHKQLTAAKTPSDQTAIQRQIDPTDRQIDQLVYELYGLTQEEIKIVEEATGR
jgi:hypothetical protein